MKYSLSNIHLLTKDYLKEVYLPVPKFAHKGSNGLGILIAGSRNMPGAALLSSKAALRSGLGKIIVHAPTEVINKVLIHTPEIILSHDPNPDCFSTLPNNITQCNALAIGPGLGKNSATQKATLELLETTPYPIIIDADALNILSENKAWLNLLPKNSILTPHAGEFDRLAGTSNNHFERVLKVQDFSEKNDVMVVLKGHYTTIMSPDRNIFMNTSGNQGMATAGSGDVLTGIILGLLAKGYAPLNAAQLGVYLHGLAGDMALEHQSFESLIASDIVENIGFAFKSLCDTL
jgi:NAD(P)H-hydrate epimerase